MHSCLQINLSTTKKGNRTENKHIFQLTVCQREKNGLAEMLQDIRLLMMCLLCLLLLCLLASLSSVCPWVGSDCREHHTQ